MPQFHRENDSFTRDAVYLEYPGVHLVQRHYGIVTKDFKLTGLRVKHKDSEELDKMYIEKYKELK